MILKILLDPHNMRLDQFMYLHSIHRWDPVRPTHVFKDAVPWDKVAPFKGTLAVRRLPSKISHKPIWRFYPERRQSRINKSRDADCIFSIGGLVYMPGHGHKLPHSIGFCTQLSCSFEWAELRAPRGNLTLVYLGNMFWKSLRAQP